VFNKLVDWLISSQVVYLHSHWCFVSLSWSWVLKTADLIEMLFGLWTWLGPRNHVFDGGPGPRMEMGIFEGGKGRPVVKYKEYCPCMAAMRPFVRVFWPLVAAVVESRCLWCECSDGLCQLCTLWPVSLLMTVVDCVEAGYDHGAFHTHGAAVCRDNNRQHYHHAVLHCCRVRHSTCVRLSTADCTVVVQVGL